MSNNKRWIPLESNPEVFTSWAIKAGLVPTQAQFQDVYGLDEELLDMVSQPVKAVILLFPDNNEIAKERKLEDIVIAEKGQPKLDKTIFWMKQTISNACGTMALIHVLANADITLKPLSPLAKFIDQCRDKTPEERAQILETTSLFEDIHTESAESGQTAVPTNLDTDLHFTCFVQAPEAEFRERAGAAVSLGESANVVAPAAQTEQDTGMRLIELDGGRGGPIDRGMCKDLLKDAASFIKSRYISQSTSMSFSMVALAASQ